MKITVIGAGYVGLVTGVSLASAGRHDVTFVERNPERVDDLRRGRMPIEEAGLAEAFAAARSAIEAVPSLEQADSPDLVFVCVATPIGEDGESDLSQISLALEALRARPELDVSVRSTLPPGFSARLPSLMDRADGKRISTNPEFLRQGAAMADFARPSRIVVGRYDETADHHLSLLHRVYEHIEAPRITVSVAAAELIKNAANAFLALKLSFVNEVAALSEGYGVEVEEVLAGIALDPRIGSTYMRPGLGFGGSCLPKELQVVDVAGRRRGLAMHIARAASQVNLEQQDRFAHRVLAELPSGGGRVGLLGLSFKADTDDLRGSPAIHVARRLVEAGHSVSAYDPAVRSGRAKEAVPTIEVVGSVEDAFDGADAVVLATEWPEFASLDLAELAPRMRSRLLFDGRGLVDPAAAVSAGMSYRGVGRRSVDPVAVPASK
ncbi:MAG TPA: nucleotide sugar dehydrogenase [Candidatus Limnocylindria bacterium]|nr:nucleotide sugar dehydrogenase [Candidatus Limnocylindria bacterium]